MKRLSEGKLFIVGSIAAAVLCSGCAASEFEPSTPGPGVPRISNFRIEPRVVEKGGEVTLRFDFRDLDGDIMNVYLGLKREVADFRLATGLRPTVVSHGRYLGQTEGTAEERITVSFKRRFAPLTSETRRYEGGIVEPERTEEEIGGVRVYEVFVVDRKGRVSNRLRARVTVR
ncbi:MAG: hypothetical protein ACE5IQ_04900 [Candidatus Methylomirabilales bacterium]